MKTVLLETVVSAWSVVQATPKRLQKVARLAECLKAAALETEICVAFLCGEPRQKRLGIGYRTLQQARPAHAAERASLTLREVDAEFETLRQLTGKGSKVEKGRRLHELLARATQSEQRFLIALFSGELRQGAQEGVLLEAVARAAQLPPSELRRALMFAGDLQRVATQALTGGASALEAFRLQLFRPLRPMLAQTALGLEQALQQLGDASVEYKLDGARVQIHKSGEEVRVYSRQLNDVTASVPEVVELARELPARQFVIDGETLALNAAGRPLPFQVTMRRFGRKLQVAQQRQQLPLSVFVFDVLHHEGEDLIDASYSERLKRVEVVAPTGFGRPWQAVPKLSCPTGNDAAEFTEAALAAGHEGVMAKQLAATYQAGRRGSAWLKVKPVHTLDLVVLAAEWGSGRRQGWLSNLHLGARDPKTDSFVMLGKTFKGLTDELLRFQTQQLLTREIGRDALTVYVRPELVVEIAFDGLQTSSQYPGGLALRFARVKRYRADKTAESADTIDTVRQLHARSTGIL